MSTDMRQRQLARFGVEAFGAEDVDGLFNKAVTHISSSILNTKALVTERLKEHHFTVRAASGWNPIFPQREVNAGPGEYCYETKQPVIANNFSEEKRFTIPDYAIANNIHSAIAVPIMGKDGTFGTLEVDSEKDNYFNEDDINFVSCYASILAAAIDRIKSLQALEESLRYKEILLAELQHRVKNNLQIIISLINQQRRSMSNDLSVITSRIEALRIIYDKLQLNNHHGKVEFSGYLAELCHNLLNFDLVMNKRISLNLETDHVVVDVDRAVPIGLIVSEFIMNSIKHAFNLGYGTLSLELRKKGEDWAELVLADDGPGISGHHNRDNRGTGIMLIGQLAEQAQADLIWRSPAKGTRLELVFETGRLEGC